MNPSALSSAADPDALSKVALRIEDQVPSNQKTAPSTDFVANATNNQPDLLIEDVTFDNGHVTWSRVAGASSYEVILAGPFERRLKEALGAAECKAVYTGNDTSWNFSRPPGVGLYYVRVRALRNSGWGPFSVPSSFRISLAWDAVRKSDNITLIADKRGFTRTALIAEKEIDVSKFLLSTKGSVISNVPLTPSSSGKATFNLRVDYGFMLNLSVGVCSSLPPDQASVGYEGFGFGYHSVGSLMHDGIKLKNASYISTHDIIRVQVDFRRKNIAFFRNGLIQGKQRFGGVDVSKPLYACVSLTQFLAESPAATLL